MMMKMITMTTLALGTMLAAPVAAQPGIVLQGPSANGFAPRASGACGVWRCGFNGVSLNGLTLNGLALNGAKLNGWTLNGLTLNGANLNGTHASGIDATGTGFAATQVTLPGGEVLAID